jgi:P-type Mg2+ transporter
MVEQVADETPGARGHPDDGIDVRTSSCLPGPTVLDRLGSTTDGLSDAEVAARRAEFGPNALRVHQARWTSVLWRQLQSPLLALLFITAAVSFAVGERADAVIIGTILAVSIGLSFVNEYRAALAAEALRSRIRHEVIVRRNGKSVTCDAMELVPGDVVHLSVGSIVPADVRILRSNGLELDESVLTGESLPVVKHVDPLPAPTSSIGDVTSCAFMGTVVRDGEGDAVVVTTGGRTEFGHIAAGLESREGETEFQAGLRTFSLFLVRVALVLTTAIFVVNVLLHHSILDALLFSLAIAVGITPQLLPAVVTTSLAAGSRRLAQRHVLIKRLVVIEDLGNIEILLTDKTGTLTEGKISFERAVDGRGQAADHLIELGLLANEATVEDGRAISGNQLDVALWDAAGDHRDAVAAFKRVATLPFDHDRRMMSAIVSSPDGTRMLITKGAPESVLAACTNVPDEARRTLDAEFAAGSRVVAIATRTGVPGDDLNTDAEHDLTLAGFLVFLDRPKADAAASLHRLAELGITTKIVTGDNAIVARKVCSDLGLDAAEVLTGDDIDTLSDDDLHQRVAGITVFARVSPE